MTCAVLHRSNCNKQQHTHAHAYRATKWRQLSLFNTKQSVFGLVPQPSTWYCLPLLLNAVLPLPLSIGTCYQLISPVAGCSAAKLPHTAAADVVINKTDGWTDARPLHRPCSGQYVGSVNKATGVSSTAHMQPCAWPLPAHRNTHCRPMDSQAYFLGTAIWAYMAAVGVLHCCTEYSWCDVCA